MVDTKKLQISFFFLVFAVVALFVLQIFGPFLEVLLSAGVFAVLLHPIFQHMLRLTKNNREVSAMMTILLGGIFIAIPMYFLGIQIVKESSGLYTAITHGGEGPAIFSTVSKNIDNSINQAFPDLAFRSQVYVENFIGSISQNLGGFLSGTAFFLFEGLLIILSLFFFLKDGPFFLKGFISLSPLEDKYDKEILDTLKNTIYSVLRGALAVAIIQGVILAIGFTIFGVPNALLWGSLAVIGGVVPGIGTAMVFVPGILYLFYIHSTVAGIGLLLWSFLLHGSIDNFVAPVLYGKGMGIHPIFMMFSVLGGLTFFGPAGFLFGPIVFSIFMALSRIYRIFILEEKGVDNSI